MILPVRTAVNGFMKRIPWMRAAVGICAVACLWPQATRSEQPPSPRERLALVDPFIGTGPDGHTFPGATVPFGMVQLSPDTEIRPFKQSYKWASGYRYQDSTILGFSHTHFSGSGHSDLGDVLVQPIDGLKAIRARRSLAIDPASRISRKKPSPVTTPSICSTMESMPNSPRLLALVSTATRFRRASQPTSSSIFARPSITTRAKSSGRNCAFARMAP